MEEKYSKFIGIGQEGIETLNAFKNKLEKNFSFEEINLKQDVDKDYVRALLDGIEVLVLTSNSEDKKVRDIVKAISFMAVERRVLCIGLDSSLKENKDEMGVDQEIKINKYNFEKIQDLLNIVVESIDENVFLAIDLTDLRDIFNKESAISYSYEEFAHDTDIDSIVKALVEETYATEGEATKKKAILFYELEKELIENELMFINDINMKVSEMIGDTYDILFSFNSVEDNDKKLKISLITR